MFHDDQHGTAIVTLAALINALQVVDKPLSQVRVALSGAGAAGAAIARLLLREGVGDLVVADRDGILTDDRDHDPTRTFLCEHSNREGRTGTLADAVRGADVFIGVSAPDVIGEAELRSMADDAVVFAMANPDPEVDPALARQHAAVVATGRSDEPNQINNVLVFPGVFRGLLDARARDVTLDTEVAAAHALAAVVRPEQLRPTYIVPSVFNERVVTAVADAVRFAAHETAPS